MKTVMKKIGIIFIDCILTGVALIVFALFHHVLPREIVSENKVVESDDNIGVCDSNTKVDNSIYSKELVYTDDEYKSENISIKISHIDEDFGNGNVKYHVAEIHIKDIESFQTVFAHDKYGKGSSYREFMGAMYERSNAVIAVNGDYYGLNGNGIVIRNGVVYSSSKGK